jgi:hypothetical protein
MPVRNVGELILGTHQTVFFPETNIDERYGIMTSVGCLF